MTSILKPEVYFYIFVFLPVGHMSLGHVTLGQWVTCRWVTGQWGHVSLVLLGHGSAVSRADGSVGPRVSWVTGRWVSGSVSAN